MNEDVGAFTSEAHDAIKVTLHVKIAWFAKYIIFLLNLAKFV